MNALLSRSGIFFLMNSSRDGRISSAIIPLCGDFDFLQTWQTSGAVLIGIRCRIKPFYRRVVDSRFNLLEHPHDKLTPSRMEKAELPLEHLHEQVHETAK